mmetsp:Transcript_5606/g.10891  ORF Transcript_5606/g.10891 Transcript_5606/m.10891 type:complete len:108 (+) Transcript_5606:855-1178(+)|eukprot:scaffold8605_cov178-Amphora_coffeaeformis.AAC.5
MAKLTEKAKTVMPFVDSLQTYGGGKNENNLVVPCGDISAWEQQWKRLGNMMELIFMEMERISMKRTITIKFQLETFGVVGSRFSFLCWRSPLSPCWARNTSDKPVFL